MNEKHPAGGDGEPRERSAEQTPAETAGHEGAQADEASRDTPGKETRETAGDQAEEKASGASGTPAEPDSASQASPPPRRGGFLAALALLVALAAGGAVGWLWWVQQQGVAGADATRADLAGDMAALDSRQENLQQAVDDLTRRLQQRQDRDASLRQEIESLAQQIRANESSLRRLQAGPEAGPDWRLAEIGHLLRVAQRELALAGNVGIALAALEAADRRAAAIGGGSLARLREQLSEDIVALRAVPRPDLDGIAMRLGSMSARVGDLPLAGQARAQRAGEAPAGEPESGWARVKAKIGGLFRNIFQVRRTEEEAVPFMAPESEFFLRRNLELELASARLALLSGEPGVYQESLRAVRRWTREYFDTLDPAVQSFLDMAGELESRRIRPEYPDLSRSLAILEGLRATAESPE